MSCFRSVAGFPTKRLRGVENRPLTTALAPMILPSAIWLPLSTTHLVHSQELSPICMGLLYGRILLVDVFMVACQSVSITSVFQEVVTLSPISIFSSQMMVIIAVLLKFFPKCNVPFFVTQILLPCPKFAFPFSYILPFISMMLRS